MDSALFETIFWGLSLAAAVTALVAMNVAAYWDTKQREKTRLGQEWKKRVGAWQHGPIMAPGAWVDDNLQTDMDDITVDDVPVTVFEKPDVRSGAGIFTDEDEWEERIDALTYNAETGEEE